MRTRAMVGILAVCSGTGLWLGALDDLSTRAGGPSASGGDGSEAIPRSDASSRVDELYTLSPGAGQVGDVAAERSAEGELVGGFPLNVIDFALDLTVTTSAVSPEGKRVRSRWWRRRRNRPGSPTRGHCRLMAARRRSSSPRPGHPPWRGRDCRCGTLDVAAGRPRGMVVDLLTETETVELVAGHAVSGGGPALAVVSANLDHVHRFGAGGTWTGTIGLPGLAGPAAAEADLAWLSLLDGAPLASRAHRLTGRFWPRQAGQRHRRSDPRPARGRRCAGRLPLWQPGHAQGSAIVSGSAPAGTRVTGHWAPERAELRDANRSARFAWEVRTAGVDLLVVGLGKPRQELWIAEHGAATGARVLLAFGAVVDFLADEVRRALSWASRIGPAWAWWLMLEPRRLARRYVVDGPEAYLALRRHSMATVPAPPAASSPSWPPAPAGTHRPGRLVTVALLVSAAVNGAVGRWDERFFLFSEETDFCHRIRATGVHVWYEPRAVMAHERGDSGRSPALTALLTVNRFRYAAAHHSRPYAWGPGGVVAMHAMPRLHDPGHRAALGALVSPRARGRLPGGDRARGASPAPPALAIQLVAAAGNGLVGAIVIPAHNEERIIARTLEPLAALAADGTVEIVVVANGCRDRTADVARNMPGVHVLELGKASKPGALNAGDAAATAWPRLYVDADVTLTPKAALETLSALADGQWLAARPRASYDLSGASRPVRSFYRARARMPSLHHYLWGAGVYGLSAAGHERLGAFPDLTADDLWVDQLFAPDEKYIVDTDPVRVCAPRDVRGLLAVVRRTARGSAQVHDVGLPSSEPSTGASTGRTVRELARTVHGPSSALDAAVYASFAVAGRLPRRRRPGTAWERDESSRR